MAKKIIKEDNEMVVQEDTMIKDLQVLWSILQLTAPEDDFEYLEEKIVRRLESFPITNFTVVAYEGYNVYQQKIPWYKLSEFNSRPKKVMHAVVMLETEGGTSSAGYSAAQNALTFRKGDGPLKFYNFKNALGSSEIFNEFSIIMQRILR